MKNRNEHLHEFTNIHHAFVENQSILISTRYLNSNDVAKNETEKILKLCFNDYTWLLSYSIVWFLIYKTVFLFINQYFK